MLTNAKGVVIIPGRNYRIGAKVLPRELERGAPIEVAGETVGYMLITEIRPERSALEKRYLASTAQALRYAGLGAAAIALVLGVLLARTLTRPLRELTQAIRAVAQGELTRRVPVRSQDELGQLAQAFNHMSADLENANQLRRQMTADIAHDLRSPITVISGYVEAMRDEVLEPSPKRLEMLYQELQHLKRLVEDLRTLSLADAGELTLNRQPIPPRTILERVAALYEHRAGQTEVTLRVQAPAELPEILVDVERMMQVLGNLVSNALRYTPEGGEIVLDAQTGKYGVQLSVRDSGRGIAPEDLPHVFERFYRGDKARQRDKGESGLGLAIAKSLVEAHGGAISVHSAPGQGATFSIALPYRKND